MANTTEQQQMQPTYEPDVKVAHYEPRSPMVLESHIPVKPAFPVINAHTHTSLLVTKPLDMAQRMRERFRAALCGHNPTSGGFLRTSDPTEGRTTIEEIVRVMDLCCVEQCVDLDGLLNAKEHIHLYGSHRNRFLLFHVLS